MRYSASRFRSAVVGLILCGSFTVTTGAASLAAPEKTTGVVELAPETAEVFSKLNGAGLDDPAGRVPNYLRAIAATNPAAVPSFAHLFKTVLYGGTIEPETKAAMGLRIAEANGSSYLATHLARVLRATEAGRQLLAGSGTTAKERAALQYAVNLTRDVHGISDSDFAQARTLFNDSQLVELTATTCFFNYFARFCQGTGLSLEGWAKEAPNALPKSATDSESARVTLASDAELQLAAKLIANSNELKKGLGIGIANSQRAMVRVPDIGDAWWSYWKAIRDETKLSREMQLQISFAVSQANGCRYCTLHQVAGLRKLGIEPAKLLTMAKDDSVLNAREKAAVTFARKLSKTPGATGTADFAALQTGLGDPKEAIDALLQTCAFNFMNRFTDGLRLPSEDEAVKTYQEVYGTNSYADFHKTHNTKSGK